jgi:hypothetical protein
MKKSEELRWNQKARNILVGRTIVKANYMSQEEADEWGWSNKPIMFELDNGTVCIVSMDDEGNNGGSLFYGNEKENSQLPTLR